MAFEKWLLSMNESQKKTMKAIEKTINSAAKEMFSKIIERTPVGNPAIWHYPAPAGYNPGTLKASWEANFNNSARSATTGQFKKLEQSSPTSGGWEGLKMNINTKEATITITNRQPYAWRVEYGSWSTQAPQGMMRITVEEYKGILERNALSNKL